MPSRLSNGTSTAMNPSRFELPALDLNFGRITDGTNIPPPPSPVQKVPTPPQTPPADKKEAVDAANGQDDDEAISTPPNGNTAASKRSVDDDVPLSPAGSGRQGSLRRLFSRNMLSATYTDARVTSIGGASVNGGRPDSRGATSVADDKWSKRSSGWFRRLRGADSKRSSFYFEDPAPVAAPPKKSFEPPQRPYEPSQKPAGPPPPMIPELADLESDEGSLGSDLFKNIK
ncbi:hypothetical protein HRG_004517 [Hirsutella rhossiliensis]|uniref:Uncharacterized protein n=1 Tax=Hirsutella rhossiliensis TaxID=111463 RepID=A0A9P8MZH4_9HYPO|nr:uncharacterized protein HRG_04517 [Hirsutella rhossiliensis]KAH0964089.1 hypothetical protein HRG_04517 [Hirsutella rhossiliensis]